MVLRMSGRISASRAAALKATQGAKARRGSERQLRKKSVAPTLLKHYEETATAAQIWIAAGVQMRKSLADTKTAAAVPADRTLSAVIGLSEPGKPREQITELTGMNPEQVRAAIPGASRFSSPGGVAAKPTIAHPEVKSL